MTRREVQASEGLEQGRGRTDSLCKGITPLLCGEQAFRGSGGYGIDSGRDNKVWVKQVAVELVKRGPTLKAEPKGRATDWIRRDGKWL